MRSSLLRSTIRFAAAVGARQQQHLVAARAASFVAAGRVSPSSAIAAVQCRMLSSVPDQNDEGEEATEVDTTDGYAPTDPQEHGIDNAAEMYTPSADAAAAMEGTAPSLLDGMAERLGPLALLVRKPTMKAINLLKASEGNADAATQRIVMTGSPGTGKSFGLLHCMDYARKAGWAVAYVPQASLWSKRAQNLEHSTWKTGRVDQHTAAGKWLEGFRQWNEHILSEHTVQHPYTFGGNKEETSMDTTLLKLVDRGIDDDRFASDIVGIVLKELTSLSGTIPMLVAVDEYNAWSKGEFPQFKDFDGVAVTTERASLVRHFSKFVSGTSTMERGAVVLAEDPFWVDGDRLEQDPLLKDSARVRYPDFDKAEMASFVKHHRSVGWMAAEASAQTLETLTFLSKRNPRVLSELVQSM